MARKKTKTKTAKRTTRRPLLRGSVEPTPIKRKSPAKRTPAKKTRSKTLLTVIRALETNPTAPKVLATARKITGRTAKANADRLLCDLRAMTAKRGVAVTPTPIPTRTREIKPRTVQRNPATERKNNLVAAATVLGVLSSAIHELDKHGGSEHAQVIATLHTHLHSLTNKPGPYQEAHEVLTAAIH